MGELRAYWWNGRPNFGDQINQRIIASLSSRTVVLVPPRKAEIFAIGSVLEYVRRGSFAKRAVKPIVWGAGAMSPVPVDFLERVDIRLVRGPLTAALLGIDGIPTGDPGLLAPEVAGIQRDEPRYRRIGVIPHHSQLKTYRTLMAGRIDAELIDVGLEDPFDVVRAIARCSEVYSSSLHGLIVADALGIPNVWLEGARIHDMPRFKFYDYAASIERPLPPPLPHAHLDAAMRQPIPAISYLAGVSAAIARVKETFPASLVEDGGGSL